MKDICQLLDKSRQDLGICGEVPVFTPGQWGVIKGSVRSLWNRLEGLGARDVQVFQVKADGPLNMEVAFNMEIETHLGSKTKVCNRMGIKNYPRSSFCLVELHGPQCPS